MSDISFDTIPVGIIRPNRWNPNRMTDEMLRKEVESIREFGFVDPVTVRGVVEEGDACYEIIDGEHRWKAALEIGLDQIPCIRVDVDDDVARQLTIVLNDLRGKPDDVRLAALVRDLSAKRSMADLERVLPYKRERLAEMVAERRADFDWESLRRPKPVEERPEPKWVERVYRFPPSAVEVVDGAIAKIREAEGVEDWQAIELMAADYMAGA